MILYGFWKITHAGLFKSFFLMHMINSLKHSIVLIMIRLEEKGYDLDEKAEYQATINGDLSEITPAQKTIGASSNKMHYFTKKRKPEKLFWDNLRTNDEKSYELTKDLLGYIAHASRNIVIEMATTSIVARYHPLNMTCFYIYVNGVLTTRPARIAKTLKGKGFDCDVIGDYEDFIRGKLDMVGNEECKIPIIEADIEAFKKEMVALLTRIQSYKRRLT